jgi:hypothetical protein
MMERTILWSAYIAGTLAGNHTPIIELPFPFRVESIKAWASNDSDATLAAATPTATVVTATTIGDSGDPKTISPDSVAVSQVAKDTALTLTLDYDGAGGTAADDVQIIAILKSGEG